ncbi:hypothetical protein D3C84_620020 [compost metagenome]
MAEQGYVVAIAHQYVRGDLAAGPGEAVVAGAGAYLPGNHSTRDGNAVVATADTDIATDATARDDDGVLAECGDQITQNAAARQLENVVVQLHVHPADGTASHLRHIAIFEGPDNSASGHEKGVSAVALSQGLNLPPIHHEVINAIAL